MRFARHGTALRAWQRRGGSEPAPMVVSFAAARRQQRRWAPCSATLASKSKGPKVTYECRECGHVSLRFLGRCPDCSRMSTLDRVETVPESAQRGGGAGVSAVERLMHTVSQQAARQQRTPSAAPPAAAATSQQWAQDADEDDDWPGSDRGSTPRMPSAYGRSGGWMSGAARPSLGRGPTSRPMSLHELSKAPSAQPNRNRLVLTGRTGHEINRVLGGGVVTGSLVLMGGEPGVGKSTLSLQIAAMIAQPDLDYDAAVPIHDFTHATATSAATLDGHAWPDSGPASLPTISTGHGPAAPAVSALAVVDAAALPAPPGAPLGGVAAAAAAAVVPKAKLRSRSQASPVAAGKVAATGLGATEQQAAAATAPALAGAEAAGVVDRMRRPALLKGDQEAAPQPRVVLYISGEETCEQVYDRAQRMGLQDCGTLHVLSESCIDEVLLHVAALRPAAIVVDSLQTMYLQDLSNMTGAVVQLKECCQCLMRLAKGFGITVFAIGHVTKSSSLAGPKVLEHMVDAVLALEGDPTQSYRLLRASKNRFGTTDEVGVFCMDPGGLHAVSDPSSLFLTNRSQGSSAAVAVLDGTRVLVLEVQALVTSLYPGTTSPPMRQATGVPRERLAAVTVNVLHKFVARMSQQNVVVSVTGGMQLRDTAADLAIALAIMSSYYDLPVPKHVGAIGEVDLGGGLRPVRSLDLRVLELTKLGLQEIIVPEGPDAARLQHDPRLAGVILHTCSTLLEALRAALGEQVGVRLKRAPRRQQQGRAERGPGAGARGTPTGDAEEGRLENGDSVWGEEIVWDETTMSDDE